MLEHYIDRVASKAFPMAESIGLSGQSGLIRVPEPFNYLILRYPALNHASQSVLVKGNRLEHTSS
jgi:hypothetical protein